MIAEETRRRAGGTLESRAAQLYFGQRTVHQFLAAKDTAARKAALILIRDHIDASVPYVYELLAFFARDEGDNTAGEAALKQLEKFGPRFANWEAKWDGSSMDRWMKAMAEAQAGLPLSFGMHFKR